MTSRAISSTRSTPRRRSRPSAVSSSAVGHVLRRHRRDDRLARRRRRDRTRPAPDRSAPIADEMRGAGLAARSGDDRARGRSRPCGCRARAARRARASAPRVSSSMRGPSRPSMTSRGMPMSAMTMSPACASPGGSTSGSFGAASVTVMPASIESPIGSAESADSPDGRSIATTGMPDALTSATTVSMQARDRRVEPGAEDARRRSACSREISEKCSSHAWLSAISTTVRPSRPRISRLMRASPRTSATAADQEHRHVDAALQQRPRDDEAVAAVVAAAAQHGHLALERDRRTSPPSRPPPAGRRSPSARATGCRSLRSCGDRLRASGRCSDRIRNGCANM